MTEAPQKPDAFGNSRNLSPAGDNITQPDRPVKTPAGYSYRKQFACHFGGRRTLARSVPTTISPAKPLSSTAFR